MQSPHSFPLPPLLSPSPLSLPLSPSLFSPLFPLYRYIMTSEYTRDTTLKFFKTHKYFGLSPDNVIVFEQDTLPCLDFEGRVILTDKHQLARAPNGNGGLYTSLVKQENNILEASY